MSEDTGASGRAAADGGYRTHGPDAERIIRPLTNTRRGHYVLLGALVVATLWVLGVWFYQLRGGMMQTTSIGDWGISGGVPWGLYIGSFVWWIGIAHGGIAISAAVRVFKLERFRRIARIAEILTILALGMAAMSIVFSLGRPDRVFNTIVQWPFTVHHSPLAWDIAVITLYMVLSLTYLTFSLRPDLHAVRDRIPWWLEPIYAVVLIGYQPDEREKVEQMLWWLALAILLLVPLLSGGVVPWLFGLIAAQPGWYGAAAGPSMLVESLTTAMAFVVITIAAFRYAYGWRDFIEDRIFRDLTVVLAVLTLATLWFVLHDILTGLYLGPVHVDDLTQTMLGLPFFWLAMLGLVVPLAYFVAVLLRPEWFSIPAVVVASGAVALSILNKKVMFIVEGLMHPTVPPLRNLYPAGFYFPNWVEWSLGLGTIVLVALGFVVISKVIPMIELEAVDGGDPEMQIDEGDPDTVTGERTDVATDGSTETVERDGVGTDEEVNEE